MILDLEFPDGTKHKVAALLVWQCYISPKVGTTIYVSEYKPSHYEQEFNVILVSPDGSQRHYKVSKHCHDQVMWSRLRIVRGWS